MRWSCYWRPPWVPPWGDPNLCGPLNHPNHQEGPQSPFYGYGLVILSILDREMGLCFKSRARKLKEGPVKIPYLVFLGVLGQPPCLQRPLEATRKFLISIVQNFFEKNYAILMNLGSLVIFRLNKKFDRSREMGILPMFSFFKTYWSPCTPLDHFKLNF